MKQYIAHDEQYLKTITNEEYRKELSEMSTQSTFLLNKLLNDFDSYSKGEIDFATTDWEHMNVTFNDLYKKFIDALIESNHLAEEALQGKRKNIKRLPAFNDKQQEMLQKVSAHNHVGTAVWVLSGILMSDQRGGMKKIYGADKVHDLLLSAVSVSMGHHNPWISIIDHIEDTLGTRDNFCYPYHPSIKHAFFMEKIAATHPNKKQHETMRVAMEASGGTINTVAIETAVAYAEKNLGGKRKLLAVDGTWAGTYGASREATGFNSNQQAIDRGFETMWVDRILPVPTAENKEQFISILKKHAEEGSLAGLYIEPDFIGDVGVISVDPLLLSEAKKILASLKLPIIADCVQQGNGRSGTYWGDNVDTILGDYEYLILTTAKSTSNGQPFAYALIPEIIDSCTYPLAHITTNTGNGGLLRTLLVYEMTVAEYFKKSLVTKTEAIEEVAKSYGFPIGKNGLRGKYLTRGVYVGDNTKLKKIQLRLLLEDGLLVGALPQTIRFKPTHIELTDTYKKLTQIIMERINKTDDTPVDEELKKIYDQILSKNSGLAIDE